MRNIALGLLAVVVLGAGGLAAIWGLPQTESPELRLRAVLEESDLDVTNKVAWFVERDDAWLGPGFQTVSEAVPGVYTAEFQILGSAPFMAETTVGEGEGGEILARLDATLVEIKLDEPTRAVPLAFLFESDVTVGSEGLRVSSDGYVRALVSRNLRKLDLQLPDQVISIPGDFASGGMMSFELTNGTVSPVN